MPRAVEIEFPTVTTSPASFVRQVTLNMCVHTDICVSFRANRFGSLDFTNHRRLTAVDRKIGLPLLGIAVNLRPKSRLNKPGYRKRSSIPMRLSFSLPTSHTLYRQWLIKIN